MANKESTEVKKISNGLNVIKKDLTKSQIEITVELDINEFNPFIAQGAESVSREVKIDGFRPGKIPYEILKAKIGEMSILEEAARIAINKTIGEAMDKGAVGETIGQPQINITKLAPGNPLEYKATFSILPEIKLGDYRDAKVKMEKDEAAGEEIEKMINQLKEMQAKEVIVEREIKEGDKAIVDIEMFLDNVPVESGQGKGTAVIIGKDYIIPGFDKNLINAKKGETREFNLIYPADHHMKNLAGKKVEFRVKIKEVFERQMPAEDEIFASKFGLKSVSELKENIKKSIEEEKKFRSEQKAEREILEKLIANTKISEIPELLVNHEAELMMHELEHSLKEQGGKFEDYLASLNKTREQILLDLLPDAVKRVKSALIIREIAKIENLNISEKEVEEETEKLLKQYKGYNKIEERLKDEDYKIHLANILANRKVMGKLREWNIEK